MHRTLTYVQILRLYLYLGLSYHRLGFHLGLYLYRCLCRYHRLLPYHCLGFDLGLYRYRCLCQGPIRYTTFVSSPAFISISFPYAHGHHRLPSILAPFHQKTAGAKRGGSCTMKSERRQFTRPAVHLRDRLSGACQRAPFLDCGPGHDQGSYEGSSTKPFHFPVITSSGIIILNMDLSAALNIRCRFTGRNRSSC